MLKGISPILSPDLLAGLCAMGHGDEVVLGSRNDRPLTRYFPELVGALRAALG